MKCPILLITMDFINFIKVQNWSLRKNFTVLFFTYVSACNCFVKSKLGPKISRNEVSTKPPMGIYNLKWNYLGFKVSNWRWFWYSKRYFGPKMTKIRFQIKPHTFFLFWMTVSVKLWQETCRFHSFVGIWNWKPKVDFIETRGIRLRRRP